MNVMFVNLSAGNVKIFRNEYIMFTVNVINN